MKLALIIGGSRGLGLALVEQYQAAGWVVYEFSRSGTGEGHIDFDLIDHDLSSYTSLLERLALQNWQEIILINNAATILPIKPVDQMGRDELQTALQINFSHPLLLLHAFVVTFSQHSARKVLAQISSGAAKRPIAAWTSYCASKAGVDHFMAVLALEQSSAKNPILAIVLDPGVMDTEMQATIRASNPAHFPELARFMARKEQGMLRPAAEVAQFCVAAIARAQQGQRYDIDA